MLKKWSLKKQQEIEIAIADGSFDQDKFMCAATFMMVFVLSSSFINSEAVFISVVLVSAAMSILNYFQLKNARK